MKGYKVHQHQLVLGSYLSKTTAASLCSVNSPSMSCFRAFGVCSLFSQEHSSLKYPCGFHLLLLAVSPKAFQLPTICMLHKRLRITSFNSELIISPHPNFFYLHLCKLHCPKSTVVRNLMSHKGYFFSPYTSKQALSPVGSFLTSCSFVPFLGGLFP